MVTVVTMYHAELEAPHAELHFGENCISNSYNNEIASS